MTKNSKLKTLVVSGVLSLGAGAYCLMAGTIPGAQDCGDTLQALAYGYCMGSGQGTPMYDCEYIPDQKVVSFVCANGSNNFLYLC